MSDIIEDLEVLLRRVINILGHILTGLCHRLEENNHRPLNSKTLVRWISVFLPRPRDPRLKLQTKLGTTEFERWGSCASLYSAFSYSSVNDLVQEDLGENIVRFRLGGADDDDDLFDGGNFDSLKHKEHLTSTPNCNVSSFSHGARTASFASQDGIANGKLAEMEEELATLRKQIAMLVMAQEMPSIAQKNEDVTLKQDMAHKETDLPTSCDSCSSLEDSGCESENVATVISPTSDQAQPGHSPKTFVAPPPPPPILATQKLNYQKTKVEFTRASCPDLVHVLKDLSNVKLKAVQRSPGGTPMRRKPLSQASDPAAIIAQALKKKFANHRGMSPDSDHENDSSSFFSDSNSPYGKNVKDAKRRLNMLCDDSDN
ncbi:mitochondrial fission regulator 2-like isoform X2 [Physella acuta]|uniref:mitochondrial fission regulator 2-like isoform X2 n=1 Tax=Physella acuta TaxID=109671 RepID=UPI0027DCB760|nr:mitochondrial fission regulator 2-like isoform X2 [Physella acuta]